MGYPLSNINVQGIGLLLMLQAMGVLLMLKGVGMGMGMLMVLIQGMVVLLLLKGMGVQLITGEFLVVLEQGQMEPYACSHSFFYSYT